MNAMLPKNLPNKIPIPESVPIIIARRCGGGVGRLVKHWVVSKEENDKNELQECIYIGEREGKGARPHLRPPVVLFSFHSRNIKARMMRKTKR